MGVISCYTPIEYGDLPVPKRNLYHDKSFEKYNEFLSIKGHSNWISYMLILKNGFLASSSFDYTINIYDIISFKVRLKIKIHTSFINFLTQIKDGRLISCSSDTTFQIIKLEENCLKYKVDQIIKEHSEPVYNIIELENDLLVSTSYDQSMRIYKKSEDKKYYCIRSIIDYFNYSNGAECLLQVNNIEFISSSFSDRNIKFWNINTFNKSYTIDNIKCADKPNCICKIDNEYFCVVGWGGIYLFHTQTYTLIQTFRPNLHTFNCIFPLRDGTFLTSEYYGPFQHPYGDIQQWEIDEINRKIKSISIKKNPHNNQISSFVQFKNGDIASCGDDIKIWK